MPCSGSLRRVCSTALISSSSQSAALCEPKPGAPPTNPKDQQAGDNEGRNLRPTVRPACQRARPRDLLAAYELPTQLMKVTKAGPSVRPDRNQEERSRNKPSKHSGTAQRRALHSSVRGAACHEQKAIAMPEASSTAIISAGRQVLQEFTVTKSIADLNSGPERLSIPSSTSEAWRFRAAHQAG